MGKEFYQERPKRDVDQSRYYTPNNRPWYESYSEEAFRPYIVKKKEPELPLDEVALQKKTEAQTQANSKPKELLELKEPTVAENTPLPANESIEKELPTPSADNRETNLSVMQEEKNKLAAQKKSHGDYMMFYRHLYHTVRSSLVRREINGIFREIETEMKANGYDWGTKEFIDLVHRHYPEAELSVTQQSQNSIPEAPVSTLTSPFGPLPETLQTKMEHSFAKDFSGVKIHKESTTVKDLQAKAYTNGTEIHFAPGEYRPETKEGQQLIGHELAHVVQQENKEFCGEKTENQSLEINSKEELEKEADEAGRLAAEGRMVTATGQHSSGVQRKIDDTNEGPDKELEVRFKTFKITKADLLKPYVKEQFNKMPELQRIEYREKVADIVVKSYIDNLRCGNGFNGMRDKEIKGLENDYDFDAEIYDPSLERLNANDAKLSLSPFKTHHFISAYPKSQTKDSGKIRVYFVIYSIGYQSGSLDQAADTRVKEIQNSSNFNPNEDFVYVLQVEDFGTLKSEIEKVVEDNNNNNMGQWKTVEVSFFTHSGMDGPRGSTPASNGSLKDVTKRDIDAPQLSPDTWKSINFNFDPSESIACFYGCNSAEFAQRFLSYQNVKYAAGTQGQTLDSYTYKDDVNEVWWNVFNSNVYQVSTMDPTDVGKEGAVQVLPINVYKRGCPPMSTSEDVTGNMYNQIYPYKEVHGNVTVDEKSKEPVSGSK